MFDVKLNFGWKKEKKVRGQRADLVTEQVRKVLTDADQKLILMVRG